jgi:hypothetical protein
MPIASSVEIVRLRNVPATSVVVSQPGGELVLSQPYAAAELTRMAAELQKLVGQFVY